MIILAVLGVVGAVVFVFLPDDANRTAEDMARAFQQARFEAVKREVPVSVVWSAGNETLQLRADVSDCAGSGDAIRTLDLSGRRIDTITVGLASGGLIWLPSNFARECDNETLFGGTSDDAPITVVGRRIERRIDISAAGLVTLR